MALKVVNTESLDAVANAINEAAGKSGKLLFPDEYISTAKGLSAGGGGEDLSTALTEQEELVAELKSIIATKAGVKIELPQLKDVNFYDYDGTLLHSYTVEEAQALTELPELPTQKGLICQGWNWSLEDIKTHNRAVNVGATYITDDGKTRLYIRIAAEGKMTVPLVFKQSRSQGVTDISTIDWGDGSGTNLVNYLGDVKISHTYSNIGDYVITLDVVDGCTVTLGDNYSSSSTYSLFGGAYVYSNMLQKIELGRNVSIRRYSLFGCYSLSSINIPKDVTILDSLAFNACNSLSSIVIPKSVTSIGGDVFYGCYSLSLISIPKSITSISSNAFYGCRSLSSIVIPESVTSIKSNAFYQCYSLSSIVIPESVTSIGNYAFYDCLGMSYYDFTHHTSVPTLSNKNAFSSIPSDCEIRVPASLYDEWIAATNWSASHISSKIVAVEV